MYVSTICVSIESTPVNATSPHPPPPPLTPHPTRTTNTQTPWPISSSQPMHGGICTSNTRIWGRILGNMFWMPEFSTQIIGSNVFQHVFFQPPPPKIHPQEIHLPKFTCQNSTQKSGKKTHCTSARPYGWTNVTRLSSIPTVIPMQ